MDQTKQPTPATPAADEAKADTHISPAPTDVAGEPGKTADEKPADDAGTGGGLVATSPSLAPEPLSDGTVPTVLTTGGTDHRPAGKAGRASLGAVYRRADIVTTLLTLAGAIVAAGVVLGAYLYFNRSKAAPTGPPKVTTLQQADLDKLGTFFGSNDLGNSAQVLTVSSSSLFKGRVALGNDLKVVGGADVTGPTTLTDLTVNKPATLAAANVRSNLTVAGPTVLQGPATLSNTTVNGSLTTSGNGSFGGSLSAGVLNIRDLSVAGTLNLAGHLAITGLTPTASPASEAGSSASANVDGNDSAGTVTINTGSIAAAVANNGGLLVTVNFRTPYAKTPHVLITPVGQSGGGLPYYVQKTPSGFTIGATGNTKSGISYVFDYWVIQ